MPWSILLSTLRSLWGVKTWPWRSERLCLVDRLLWVVCVTGFPLQVSDRGGGVPLRKIERLFTYTYSTAPRPSLDGSRAAPLVSIPEARLQDKASCSQMKPACLLQAGYGYGLPISRLYARYFQGDLKLYSLEGYGTDAVIYIRVTSWTLTGATCSGVKKLFTLFYLLFPSIVRHFPRSRLRDSPSTTNPLGNIIRRSMRLTTGACPARSPKTWQHFAASRPKQQHCIAVEKVCVKESGHYPHYNTVLSVVVSCLIQTHWEVTWIRFPEGESLFVVFRTENFFFFWACHYPLVDKLKVQKNFLQVQNQQDKTLRGFRSIF